MECLFCKIAAKEIKSEIVYEDKEMAVFKDVGPQAPVHLLIVPKKHIESLNDVSQGDVVLLGNMLAKAKDLAKENNLSESGYRVVINCRRDAGQAVPHLHVHFLGGRRFTWPAG